MNNRMAIDLSQTCDLLLSYVKKSNLNFSLNESPFAVSISIKKTYVKDKNGTLRQPLFGIDNVVKKENQNTLEENRSLNLLLGS